MRYSIAIPTHNNCFDDIKRCILSAMEVGFDDYEVVVSDTSDTEANFEYIKELIVSEKLTNVTIFHNDSKWTMWDNHNYLLERVNGDYILFLHSDDVILKNALSEIDLILKSHNYPSRIMIAGTSIFKSYKTTLDEFNLPTDEYICGSQLIELFARGGLTPSGTLFSKDIKDIGGFIVNSMILPYSDCWTEINCALNGFRLIFSNNIFFIRDSNGTKMKYGSDESIKQVYERMKPYFDESLSMVIINAAFKSNSWVVLKHFTFEEKYKKIIMKRALVKLILHPYKNRRIRRLFYWRGK